jgi:hypothetical protein
MYVYCISAGTLPILINQSTSNGSVNFANWRRIAVRIAVYGFYRSMTSIMSELNALSLRKTTVAPANRASIDIRSEKELRKVDKTECTERCAGALARGVLLVLQTLRTITNRKRRVSISARAARENGEDYRVDDAEDLIVQRRQLQAKARHQVLEDVEARHLQIQVALRVLQACASSSIKA